MVRLTKEKPACFKNMDDVPMFFDLYDGDIVYANAALDFRYPPNCLFHLEVHKWHHKILRMLIEHDWPIALKIMKKRGTRRIVATKAGTLEHQKPYVKLVKLFGFCQPVEFTLTEQIIKQE